jgi:hypothetical protein
MARIVPSQVVEFIQTAFPWVNSSAGMTVGIAHMGQLAALVRLTDAIPEELIVLDGDELVLFSVSLEVVRNAVVALPTMGKHFGLAPSAGGVSPIASLYRTLKTCPDESPSADVAELAFVDDETLRHSLRIDLDNVRRALSTSEWKAATVLAGSIVEALLLWSIERLPGDEIDLVRPRVGGLAISKAPNHWTLHEYGRAARELDHIDEPTAALVDLTKHFRNLIHPGKEARTGARCDRGTAFAATAAVEHVARDLERRAAR